MSKPEQPSFAPEDMAMIGRILFGSGWRLELAVRLGVTEDDIVRVEAGTLRAPDTWRGQLIALAQDFAVRALEAANNLLTSARPAADEFVSAPRQPLYA